MSNPIFTITMENGAVMKGELYPETAPQSVYNFIDLANKGFYDGLIFHRVIKGFMIR
ncbi:MAG: peptidylprolyl isomerase [Oscillospiraceae bacterium]|nr:peptidylprolyl isomerase [Oscillospiraceae bacterium]